MSFQFSLQSYSSNQRRLVLINQSALFFLLLVFPHFGSGGDIWHRSVSAGIIFGGLSLLLLSSRSVEWRSQPGLLWAMLFLLWEGVNCFFVSRVQTARMGLLADAMAVGVFVLSRQLGLLKTSPRLFGIILPALSAALISVDFLIMQTGLVPLGNPNIVAGYLLAISVFVLFSPHYSGRWIVFFFISVTIFLTKSVWASLIIIMALLIYFNLRASKVIISFLFGLTAVFAMKISYGVAGIDHVFDRLFWWISSIKMIFYHPFMGVGLGHFGVVYPQYAFPGIQSTIFAHQHYFERIAEIGIIGFILWCLWVWSVLREEKSKNDFRGRRVPHIKNRWSYAARAGAIVILVHNVFDYSLAIPAVSILFGFFMGCSGIWRKAKTLFIQTGARNLVLGLLLVIGLRLAQLSNAENAVRFAQEAIKDNDPKTAYEKMNGIWESQYPDFFETQAKIHSLLFRQEGMRGSLMRALNMELRAESSDGMNPQIQERISVFWMMLGKQEKATKSMFRAHQMSPASPMYIQRIKYFRLIKNKSLRNNQ